MPNPFLRKSPDEGHFRFENDDQSDRRSSDARIHQTFRENQDHLTTFPHSLVFGTPSSLNTTLGLADPFLDDPFLDDPFADSNSLDDPFADSNSIDMQPIKYVPWETEVDPGFWITLANIKVNHDKLDESKKNIIGMYDVRVIARPASSCRLMLGQSSLSGKPWVLYAIRCEGSIKNFNTMEGFTTANRANVITEAAAQIWDAILDGTIYSIPSMLATFTIISFADLKKYKFYSWFAFPAIQSDWSTDVELDRPFTGEESTALVEEVGTYKRRESDERQHGFFLAKKVHKIAEPKGDKEPGEPAATLPTSSPSSYIPPAGIDYDWTVGTLGDFERGFFDGVDLEDQYVCFVDPSTYEEAPAWLIRNLLVLVRYRYKLRQVQILCYRDIHARREDARSIVIKFFLPKQDAATDLALANPPIMPKVVGWQRSDGKLRPTVIDLGAYMDPKLLADQSVDLNNKLMKWRIAPNLDLDAIKETKCLLLGAGTLGSYVARNLLGWGVRKITFVDNGMVSYSNPVRQPLFAYKDCVNGGSVKAERAAEALQEIYPGVDSKGYRLSVPMLGHPLLKEAETKSDYDTLKRLIDEHDAVFLLMDTRESRWLPTVMGKATGKIVLNAALGFDTYLVMRHGVTATDGGEAELGCYFCNDVVAPENSTKDVTLDQQCTVTRPGVAPIASALAVELLTSILQHPLRAHASAPISSSTSGPPSYEREPQDHPLGIIPHQIRGFLGSFQNMIIKGQSYDCCSACSPKIVDAYKKDGFEFVKKALSERDYVEELSGLAEVKAKAMEVEVDGWSSEDGDIGDGEPVLLC